jgi:hypothetical protein
VRKASRGALPSALIPLALLLTASTPSPLFPAGWWIVEAAGGKDMGTPGAAWRFRRPSKDAGGGPDEIIAVDAVREAVRRSELICRSVAERVWQCERQLTVGKQYLHLVLKADGELVGTGGREGETPAGQMTARRAKPAEADALELLTARELAEAEVACGRARRCYAVACPAFGQAEDPCIFERHSLSHDAPSCLAMVPVLASTLRQLGKPVPPECGESKAP